MQTEDPSSPGDHFDNGEAGADFDCDDDVDASGEGVDVLQESNKSFISHMVGQLRNGADLSKIPFPTFILEPRSLLEKLTDLISYPELLVQAQDFTCPVARMSAFVRWYVSGYHVKPKAVKKPYNPVLGETFQCFWEFPTPPTFVGGPSDAPKYGAAALPTPLNPSHSRPLGSLATVNVPGMAPAPRPPTSADAPRSLAAATPSRVHFRAEQVSHHPPVTALYCESRSHGIVGTGWYCPRSKFLGNSVASVGEGWATYRFCRVGGFHSDDDTVVGPNTEHYTMTWPSAYVRGILWGKLIMELGQKVTIACPESGVSCEIEFKTKPMWGGDYGRISGKIFITAGGAAAATRVAREAATGTPSTPGPSAASGARECVRVIDGMWGSCVTIKPGPSASLVRESTEYALRVARARVEAARRDNPSAYEVRGGFDTFDLSWVDPSSAGATLMRPPTTRYRMQFPPKADLVENFSRNIWHKLTRALGGVAGYGVRCPEHVPAPADSDAANAAKHEVEDAQRALRKSREQEDIIWRPALFRPAIDRTLLPPLAAAQDASAGIGGPRNGGGGCWQVCMPATIDHLVPGGEPPTEAVVSAAAEAAACAEQNPPPAHDDDADSYDKDAAPPAYGVGLFSGWDSCVHKWALEESLSVGMLRTTPVAQLPQRAPASSPAPAPVAAPVPPPTGQ